MDTKTPLLPQPHRLSKTRLLLYSGLASLTTWFLTSSSPHQTGLPTPQVCDKATEFKWSDITPTPDLHYHPCWDGFQCARLQVPLDWEDPDGLKAAVAIVKVPAKVDERSAEWGGPVLLNPGGPGGSGVELALTHGVQIQTILGGEYSVLGFDPRGVNNTKPSMYCFDTEVARKVWGFKSGGQMLGSSEGGEEISESYSRARVVGEMCGEALGGEGLAGVGRHVGTAVVARDMLEITDREWKRVGETRKRGLRYWGFSYGSVLGSTFASMFPDRVERLVVDGVCDVDDYYKVGWMTNLQDTEKVMASFYAYCSEAGPELCAFHTGSTPADISERLATLTTALKRQPLPVPDALTGGEIVTSSDVKMMLFRSFYKPIYTFPEVARILADLEKGDGKSIVAFIKAGFDCNCSVDPLPVINQGSEIMLSIACSDGEEVNDSLETFREYFAVLKGQSETVGGIWATARMGCIGWKLRPASLKYNGPFVGNTSWPLLFIGNSADPVTPLRNAYKMAKGYNGAVVLEQHSEGHCSLAAPSLCTMKYVREYFKTGVLPPKDTVCETESKPFFGGENVMRVLSEDDRVLLEAITHAGREWKTPRFGY